MTCKDAIALLGDYLESALTDDALAQLEAHLGECAPCRAYLSTYRRTRDLTAEEARVEMPAELRERLRTFLVEEIRKRRADG
jgi:predicted anti-sigma-YlaC factor YlaD